MATFASILWLEEHESHFEFMVEELHYPTYSHDDQTIHAMITHDSSHYASIFSYLRDQIVPDNLTHNEKCQLICNASHFILISSDLYRKILDGTLLRCLEKEDSDKAPVDVHDSICGSHSNSLALAQKL